MVGYPTRGSKLGLAFTGDFESLKYPKTIFLRFVYHQDYIARLCSQYKSFFIKSIWAKFGLETTVSRLVCQDRSLYLGGTAYLPGLATFEPMS